MKLDFNKEGLDQLYPQHTSQVLRYLWDIQSAPSRGLSIKELHEWYIEYAEANGLDVKSRTSIANSLTELERDGIIGHYEKTGQGGIKLMYYHIVSPQMFSVRITERLGKRMQGIFTGAWWKL